MAPVGALLWRSLRVYQVYGANTGVGKTIFTTLLCNAAKEHWQQERVAYLKPVSTGPSSEADDECEFSHAPPAPRLLGFPNGVSDPVPRTWQAGSCGYLVGSTGPVLSRGSTWERKCVFSLTAHRCCPPRHSFEANAGSHQGGTYAYMPPR